MSKYEGLREYIQDSGKSRLELTFDEIARIAGVPIDHSFLKYRKELCTAGYRTEKISLKERTVVFTRLEKES